MTFEKQIEYNADCLIKLGKERWLKARRNPKKFKAYMHEVEQQERLLEIEWEQEGEVFKSDCGQYECRPSIWPYIYEGKDLLKPYWFDNGTWRPICTLIKSRLAKKVCEDHKAFLARKQAKIDAGETVNVIKVRM